VHHVGILYGQFMMHGQRNIKFICDIKGKTFIKGFCFMNEYTRLLEHTRVEITRGWNNLMRSFVHQINSIHGSEDSYCGLLGYDTMESGRWVHGITTQKTAAWIA